MKGARKILVFHTAFLGDIILSLPLVQALRREYPDAFIAFAAIPASAGALRNHPAIDLVIEYDKKGKASGISGIREMADSLKSGNFDTAIVPHRSVRSALIVALAGIPRRIGFSTSSGRWLLTDRVKYRNDHHEIDRNLALAFPLGIRETEQVIPELYPSKEDVALVRELLRRNGGPENLVGVAPGSVWATKRWPEERFQTLVGNIIGEGLGVVLVGGRDDRELCERIAASSGGRVFSTAGDLSVLQSAEVLRMCLALISNDSAPMHIAVSVRTPVISLYGPTVPRFGFAPRGVHDHILETNDLFCRPCSIHGGESCPVGTFDCMKRISPEAVLSTLMEVLSESAPQRSGSGR